MTDISSPEFIWEDLLHWRRQGKDPPARELADIVSRALEAHGVPEEVREYLAKRIRDEIHLGDGGRPANERARWTRAKFLTDEVRKFQAAFRLQQMDRPRDRAVKLVAVWFDLAPSTLETILKRDLRDAPLWMRRRKPIKHVEAWVQEWVETGEVALDPKEGLLLLSEDEADEP